MARNEIIPYKRWLKMYARKNRKKMTLAEVLLWQQIRKRKLGVQFHRQLPIDRYIADFYCHEIKLAIEVDGSSHDSVEQQNKDRIRDQKFRELGVTVIRIPNSEILNNMDGVIRYLQKEVDEPEGSG